MRVMHALIQASLFPRFMAYAFVVVLEFDGSFRPPRDPGYPTIPSKIAACSASISTCISIDGTTQKIHDDTPRHPVAVGCHWLPFDHELTSSHAEYGGLLLGLEFLNGVKTLPELIFLEGDESKRTLVIRGDCKAVIDQLSGRSIPRKVESLHNKAQGLLDQLETKFDNIEAIHIPREDNVLCDSLCSNLMNVIEWKELASLMKDLEKSWANCIHDCAGTVSQASSNQEKEAQDMNVDYLFSRYLKSEFRCRIKYSWRPALYQAIASLAIKPVDLDTLVEIGERQAAESTIRKDKVMLAQGIRNQIRGWAGQGKVKKAAHLARKHRILLSTFGGQDQDSDLFNRASMLVPVEDAIQWHDDIHHDWHHLLEKFRSNAMAKTWCEGSKLWVQ